MINDQQSTVYNLICRRIADSRKKKNQHLSSSG